MKEKIPENTHDAEGFAPFSNEELTALKSRIQNETSDPVVKKIIDRAFTPQENSDEPNVMADTPQEVKDQPEHPGIKGQPGSTQDRRQEDYQGKNKTIFSQKGKRIQIIHGYIKTILKKSSIRYLIYMMLVLLIGLFLGWLLVPIPPPFIIG